MSYELLAVIGVLGGLLGGAAIGAWIAGDFAKSYPGDFVPGPRFRAGISKNPEE